MINNRQTGRRNRGRSNSNNNGRPNNQNRGGGDTGNRIDNRARGNATQLLEKYRNMARDAQLAGDRVNTEYYLQFADHYFRVLADNRARQEEAQGGQQPMRPRPEPTYDEFGDEYDSGDISNGGGDYEDRPQQAQRDNRDNGRENGRDGQRDNVQRENSQRDGRQSSQGHDTRGNEGRRNDYRNEGRNDARSENREEGRRDRQQPRRDDQRRDAPVAPAFQEQPSLNIPVDPPVSVAEPAAEAPRRRGRPPKNRDAITQDAPAMPVEAVAGEVAPRRGLRQRTSREDAHDDNGGGLDLTVLPPAIARADEDNDSAQTLDEAPRKRVRRARPAAEAAE